MGLAQARPNNVTVSTCDYTIIIVLYLLGTLVNSYHDPFEFIMTEYTKHKRDDDSWYSPPFYTGPGGYKMCIRVIANGRADGAGTHVTVRVLMMRGEHDDWLVWPFLGNITIKLVNQNGDRDHDKSTVHFSDPAAKSSQRVIARERSEYSRGFDQFISHLKLQSTTAQYLKNDCLKLRVTKIVVHSK